MIHSLIAVEEPTKIFCCNHQKKLRASSKAFLKGVGLVKVDKLS
jgi:hypothetical protein